MSIFISYVREDHESAVKLYHDLRRSGFNPWLDSESLIPGQNWKDAIADEIRNSDFVIILMSQRAITKRGVFQSEVKEALRQLDEIPPDDIFLIPVRLDEVTPNHRMLQHIQWVDLFPSYERGVNKLVAALRQQQSKNIEPTPTLPQGNIPPRSIGLKKRDARHLLRVDDYDAAVSLYSEKIEDNPRAYTLYIGRAKALYYLGRKEEALLDLEFAEKVQPHDNAIRNVRETILAGSVFATDRPSRDDIVTRNLLNIGNEAVANGDIEKAKRFYEEAAVVGVSKATLGICMAMVEILRDDLDAAEVALHSFNTEIAGPNMNVMIQVIAATLAVLRSEKPDIERLRNARLAAAGFDLERNPLPSLFKGLAKLRKITSDFSEIIHALRYPEKSTKFHNDS